MTLTRHGVRTIRFKNPYNLKYPDNSIFPKEEELLGVSPTYDEIEERDSYIQRYRANYNNKIVLDLGADFGSTAYFFIENGAKKVYAVECEPIHYKNLLKTAETIKDIIPIFCKVKTASDWEDLINTTKPDIIKADCEGCEETGLPTISDDSIRKVPEWIIEVHGKHMLPILSKRFKSNSFETEYCFIHGTGQYMIKYKHIRNIL